MKCDLLEFAAIGVLIVNGLLVLYVLIRLAL